MTWADEMAGHSEAFRAVWKLHGGSYLRNQFAANPDQAWDEYDSSIREVFTEFASGDLDSVTSIINYLNGAAHALESDASSNFDGVRRGLVDWRGDAAEGFSDYLNQMEDAVNNVLTIIDAARRSVVAYQELLTSLHNDVNELVEQTHDALDKVAEERADEGNRIGLTIISSIVAVGAAALAVPSAGTSTALSFPALAAVGSALSSGAASVAVLKVGGSTEGAVIVDMLSQTQGILDEAREGRYRVEKALYEVTTFLTDAKPTDPTVHDTDTADLLPKRPAIVTDDRFDQDQFRPDDQPEEDRRGLRKDDLVAEPDARPDHERDHYLRPPENKVPQDQAPDPDVAWLNPIPGDPDAPDKKPETPGPDSYDERATATDGKSGGGRVR